MAGLDPGVECLDEFDEAEEMSTTFCPQMTEEEYENQTSEATEKALNELFFFLQENPEAYYRIVRKRRQEEMENAGIFSYLKVKMMSFLHGEQYPACLVSPEQSAQQLAQLRVDMQKAFAYSEESKGRRYSKRVAARRGQRESSNDKENTPVLPSQQPLRRTRLESRSKDATLANDSGKTRVLRSASKMTKSSHEPTQSSPLVMAVLPCKTMSNPTPGVPLLPPPSPPPPPPPPLLPQHRLSVKLKTHSSGSIQPEKRGFQQMSEGGGAGRSSSMAQSPSPLSPAAVSQSSNSSSSSRRDGGGIDVHGPGDAGDTSGFTPSVSTASSPSDAEFVTPEADVPVFRKHKRTLSSASTGSTSSQSSLNSIHSELMASNPISRLRCTQIARSPGGTPLRSLNGPRSPQEPLHKALVMVLRQKFKNVRTPSPLTTSSTTSVFSPDATTSKNNSLNTTFSP